MCSIQLDSVEISHALSALNHIPFGSLAVCAWLFFPFIQENCGNLLNGCHSRLTNNPIGMYFYATRSAVCLTFLFSSSFTTYASPQCSNVLRITSGLICIVCLSLLLLIHYHFLRFVCSQKNKTHQIHLMNHFHSPNLLQFNQWNIQSAIQNECK